MALPKTMATNIILTGGKTAWVFKVTSSSTSAVNYFTFTPEWFFKNCKETKYTLPPSASATSSDNIDITHGDGSITRFAKESKIVNGISENADTSSSSSSGNSSSYSMSIQTNEAPIRMEGSADEVFGMTGFEAELETEKDVLFLIVIGTGYSYNRTGTGQSKKPDGFAYMLGKRSNSIEIALNENPLTPTIEFTAQAVGDAEWDEVNFTAFQFTGLGIDVVLGGEGKDIPGTVNIPIDLNSTDIGKLKNGEIVIKKTSVS